VLDTANPVPSSTSLPGSMTAAGPGPSDRGAWPTAASRQGQLYRPQPDLLDALHDACVPRYARNAMDVTLPACFTARGLMGFLSFFANALRVPADVASGQRYRMHAHRTRGRAGALGAVLATMSDAPACCRTRWRATDGDRGARTGTAAYSLVRVRVP